MTVLRGLLQHPTQRCSINDDFVAFNSLERGCRILQTFWTPLTAMLECSGSTNIGWIMLACLLKHGEVQNGRVLVLLLCLGDPPNLEVFSFSAPARLCRGGLRLPTGRRRRPDQPRELVAACTSPWR